MTQDDESTSAQARKGLLDRVTGAAKEVTGAVTGNDDLAEEGQLQQAEGEKRKAATADEAEAHAKRDAAAREFSDQNREAAAEKEAADAGADAAQRAVDHERAEEHVLADQDEAQRVAAGRRASEQRAAEVAETGLRDAEALAVDAAVTEQQADIERARLEREAAADEEQAAQLRDRGSSKE